ncbi:hypothetical protein Tco_1049290 [Tanacetum coccineum]
MDGVGVRLVKEVAVGVDAFTEEEYVKGLALCLSNVISEDSDGGLNVEWAPLPNEVTGASLIIPSPLGLKLLAVRNPKNDLTTYLEIWGPFQLEKEIRVPQSMHGSMYADGWYYKSFERYDIVNGVVVVDGVKDEAETGATYDSAKEGVHQVVADPSLSLKLRSLVTYDVVRAFEKAKMMLVETYNEMLRRHMSYSELVVLAPNIPEMYELHFAVPMAGALLYTLNICHNLAMVSTLLKHSGAKLIFVDYQFLDVAKGALEIISKSLPTFPQLVLIPYSEKLPT